MARSLLVLFSITLSAFAEPRLDRHGDPLPDGAIARIGTVRYRIGELRTITTTALSPDGKLLAIARKADVCIWDTDTGRRILRFEARCVPHEHDRSLGFSSDGTYLAGVGERDFWIIDAKTGKETLHSPLGDWRKSVVFIPNSTRVGVWNGFGTNAFVLDAAKGAGNDYFEPDARIDSPSYSGRFYIGLADDAAHLVDAGSGRVTCRFPECSQYELVKADLTADDQLFCALYHKGRIVIFDSKSGKKIGELGPPPGWNRDCSGAELLLSQKGTIAYVWQDELRIQRLDLKTRLWIEPLPELPTGKVILHPDGKHLLLLGNDGILRRYDLATFKEIRTVHGFDDAPHLAVSPDGLAIAVTSGWKQGQVDLFDLNGKLRWTAPHQGWTGEPRWSADGRLLAYAGGTTAFVRDANTGKVHRAFRSADPDKPFTGLVGFTPDGQRLRAVLNKGYAVATMRLDSLEPVQLVETGGIRGSDLSRDGKTMAFSNGSPCVALFDLEVNRFRVDYMFAPPPLRGCGGFGITPDDSPIRFSPDGSYAASLAEQGLAFLWDPITGESKGAFDTGSEHSSTFAFSPDGLWLIVGGTDGNVSLWETSSGQRLVSWQAHDAAISSVAFAGMGKLLTGSADTTILVWDMRPRKKLSSSAWAALCGDDAREAYRATWALADNPKGPGLLRAMIPPAKAVAPDKVKQWLADLDADKFALRQTATKELQSLGRLVEPDLCAVRVKVTSEEARTRLDALLTNIPRERSDLEIVHARAVAAMELAGSDAAKKLLAEWASGAPGARLTIDAKAALERLNADKQ